MLHRRLFAALLGATLVSTSAFSAIITISFDSGGSVTIKDNLGVDLPGGSTVDGNGAVIQLGYYSSGSAANNFLGTWVPLTGDGSANTGNISLDNTGTIALNQTSVGDNNDSGAGDGTFAMTVNFDTNVSSKSQNLPSLTTIPLVIRFYNATTFGGASLYNAVSRDTGWLWQTPADAPNQPVLFLSLADPGLEWESTAQGQSVANETKTTLVLIPEPSSLAVVLAGMVGLAAVRRRRTA